MAYEYQFVEFAEVDGGAWEFHASSGPPVAGASRVAAYANALGAEGWSLVQAEVIARPIPRGCLAALLGAPQRYARTMVVIFQRPTQSP